LDGANTGAFSALHTLLLAPLPYSEPARMVSLYETTVDQKPRASRSANLLDWRTRTNAFEAMAIYQPRSFGLTMTDQDTVTVFRQHGDGRVFRVCCVFRPRSGDVP